jgi:hypothetical protein
MRGGAAYRTRGAPPAALRALAPVLAATTVVVLASGVALLAVGPHSRGVLVPSHKVSFILWGVAAGLHVLAHLGHVERTLSAELTPAGRRGAVRLPGPEGRLLSVVGAGVAGTVLAVVLVPEFSSWVHWSAHHHHEH